MVRLGRLGAAVSLVAVSAFVGWVWMQGVAARRLVLPARTGGTAHDNGASAAGNLSGTASGGRESLSTAGFALGPPAAFTAAAAHELWHATDGPAPEFAGAQNGLVHDLQHVRIDREAIQSLEVGSLVALELPDGQHLLARVQDLVLHENGDRSWSGHLDGFGTRYPVVYTQGEIATFGTIATPTGLFALEALGEEAVLFRDEREGLQEPGRECVLLPG